MSFIQVISIVKFMKFSEIFRDLLNSPTIPLSTHHNTGVLHKTYDDKNFNADHNNNNKFCLLLSHGISVHELFFTECINQFLQNHFTSTTTTNTTISSIDKNSILSNDQVCNTIKCIIFCFHKSWNIYQKLLNPLYTNNVALKDNLTIVDMTVILENLLMPNRNFDSDTIDNDYLSNDKSIGTIIKDYIKEKTNEFLMNNSTTTNPSNNIVQGNIGIFIDNISALHDLGVTIRELEQLLCSWLYLPDSYTTISKNNHSLICVGLHVGDHFQDSIISEYEPALVHLIGLWKSRATVTLECKPLQTGYTSLVDGQLICWKRSKVDNANLQNVTSENHIYTTFMLKGNISIVILPEPQNY
ncbi:hypothetical protein MN116_008308 [Schistosoma mekongi]|uniref:Uncharacterized protein n=1 Tax=Schistosoma mekongi TaxID=38744 RepID=A0AAE2D1Q1_SCHME|nr:hypothetical protein MN116_008308 [Schistosoma mekongi]